MNVSILALTPQIVDNAGKSAQLVKYVSQAHVQQVQARHIVTENPLTPP